MLKRSDNEEGVAYFPQTGKQGMTTLSLSKAWDSIARQVNWYQVAIDAEVQMAFTYRDKFQEIMYAHFEREMMKEDTATYSGGTGPITTTNHIPGNGDEDRPYIVIDSDDDAQEVEEEEEWKESACNFEHEDENTDDTDEDYIPLEVDGSDGEYGYWEL